MSIATVLDELQQRLRYEVGPAQTWHQSYWSQHAERYRADLQLLSGLRPTGPLLEVGAAPCHMTALMSRLGYEVVGVDLRPERVGRFIESMGLDVRRCDVEREPLPLDDESFAGVLLCDVFEHLRIDPLFVMSEINRVLALNGFLLFTTPNVYSLPSIARYTLGKSMADPLTEYSKLRTLGHMGHVREYSSREVLRLLEAFGFTAQQVNYRSDPNPRGRRRKILNIAYKLVPRRFLRDIVIIARKTKQGPALQALS